MAIDGYIEVFLEMVAAERGASQNTLAAYGADLSDFSRFLTDRGGAATTAQNADLADYLKSLASAGFSPRTQARRLSALRQFFSFLLSEGIRTDNPSLDLTAPRLPHSLPKYLSEAEVDNLLTVAATSEGISGLKLRAGLEILYATGLRVSELLALPATALSSGASMLIIKGKGGKERIVPLSDAAKCAAADLRDKTKQTGRFLFAGRDPRRKMTRQGFALMLKKVAVRANIDPLRLSPHVLRHSFATHLLSHGADLRSIQRLLGHADITTTQIYTQVLAERLQRLIDANHPLA
jgi:integrase/recombinase XerD